MAIKFKADPTAAAQDSNYPVAPAGKYYLRCVDATEEVSKNSGRDMIRAEYVISEGEFQDRVHIWNYITFMNPGDKGYGMAIHALKAHGLQAEGDLEISADQFIGVQVEVDLDTETYNGKVKNVIKKFHLPPGGDDDTAAEPVAAAAPTLATRAASAGLTGRVVTPAAPAARKPAPWAKKK